MLIFISQFQIFNPGFPDQVAADHTLIIYGTIQIIQFFFYDLTMINLESYMIQSMVNLEPLTSMVQSGIINGPDYDQTEIINF